MNIVVVSPHLDDGVLSLGATMNRWVREGHSVKLVTVFAGNPDNDGPPLSWDAPRGTRTAGEVVAARCAEDAAAARVLGVEATWLPFDEAQHLVPRDPHAIWEALGDQLVGADRIYVPGWPLGHYDHWYAAMLTFQKLRIDAPLGLYCELPYAVSPVARAKSLLRGRSVPFVEPAVSHDLTWSTERASPADRLSKIEALECYVGEVAALGWTVPLSPSQRRSLRVERTSELLIRNAPDSEEPESRQE